MRAGIRAGCLRWDGVTPVRGCGRVRAPAHLDYIYRWNIYPPHSLPPAAGAHHPRAHARVPHYSRCMACMAKHGASWRRLMYAARIYFLCGLRCCHIAYATAASLLNVATRGSA